MTAPAQAKARRLGRGVRRARRQGMDALLRNGARAVAFDEKIRTANNKGRRQFIHRSLVPLADVDFSDAYKNQINMFENDCESGVCGV